MSIKITERAKEQIEEMMKIEEDDVHLRFGVQGGGCSGLSYSIGFEYEINSELDHVEKISGIPVVIFRQDIPMVENTVIDFKDNLMGGGFSIDNPNAILSCGCGSSFRVPEYDGTPEKC